MTKEELLRLIGRGNTKSVFQELDKIDFKDNELENELAVLSNRFEQLERRRRLGVLRIDEEQMERNQIISSLLSFIKRIQPLEQVQKISKNTQKTTTSLNNRLKKLIAQNRTSEAFKIIQDYNKSSQNQRLNNDLTLLFSQFNELNNQRIRGLLSDYQFITAINKINFSLLELIDKIDFGSKKEMNLSSVLSYMNSGIKSINNWNKTRNVILTRNTFNVNKAIYSDDTSVEDEADSLIEIMPERIIESIKKRVSKCWINYDDILNSEDEYLPQEVDTATNAVIKCVCRELKRMKIVNGSIPKGVMKEWWNRYECENKN